MSKFPTAFAERNKVAVAIIGIVTLVIIFLATFNAAALPIIGGGSVHTARFAESAGLASGDDVRVAGVEVGEVTDVSLDGDVVDVDFRIKGIRMGSETTAAIKVKTLLGRKFLAIEPGGHGTLDGPIPLENTTTPYDVNAAFSDLSDTVDEIDMPQLEKSFEVLSNAFKDTPKSVQTMIQGLTDLSRTISTRDEKLADLLEATNTVTGTLKDRNAEFASLIQDGDALLTELDQRRESVHKMLTGTARLGKQLKGLVKDNEKQLRPALEKLDKVAAILQKNQKHLDEAMKELGPYYRVLTSATGNGRWVDSYICGLFKPEKLDDGTVDQVPVLENDVVRNCTPRKGGGK